MDRPRRFFLRRALAAGCCAGMFLAGCNTTPPKPPPLIPKHPDLGPKANVPPFLHGSIWERVELGNTEPYPVSSYGLVVNLANTGDTTGPQAVREYITK